MVDDVTVCVSIRMCLLSPLQSPLDPCGAMKYFISYVQEKGNVMEKCCLPECYSHSKHFLLVGRKEFFRFMSPFCLDKT